MKLKERETERDGEGERNLGHMELLPFLFRRCNNIIIIMVGRAEVQTGFGIFLHAVSPSQGPGIHRCCYLMMLKEM